MISLVLKKHIRKLIYFQSMLGEESGIKLDVDISERDSLFRDAAEVIVTAQQGSASLIQRKLKIRLQQSW